MPAMIVWPVSRSVCTTKVGSSSESELSALPSLSWSFFVFGSIATEITGVGNSMRSSTIGCARSHSVSPVVVCLKPRPGDDVARVRDVDVLALVGVHPQDATDALLAVLRGVVDLRALLERARVDAEVGELAVRVGDDLERERRERLVFARLALDRLLALQVGALRRRHVERRRQVVDDRVEHGLHALVLERRAAQHRHELEPERAEPESRSGSRRW